MSSFFQKSLSLIVQIVLVVILVLVFAWYDPFNMFEPVKIKLKNTPVQVESIQKIGKLISAEYYGETIASLNEVVDEELQLIHIDFSEEIDQIHAQFKENIATFQRYNKKVFQNASEYQVFQDSFPIFSQFNLAEIYLNYTFSKLSTLQSFTSKDFEDDLTHNQKEKLFRKLRNSNDWKNNFNTLNTNDLKKLFNNEETKKSYKKYRKARLVIVGRGWIKAGFNFETFNEKNFRYDAKRNAIYFIGMQPQILSKTMNPWFIPEEGVEGFEFVMAEKGGLYNPEFTQKVKAKCLEKLETQAMQKQLLVQAKINAEEQLKQFFGLLMDKEIKKVVFYSNYLDYTLNSISDTLKNESIQLIDTALRYYSKAQMDSIGQPDAKLDTFVQKIRAKKYVLHTMPFTIHARSASLYKLLRDFKIDGNDSLLLANIATSTSSDSLFYHDLLSDPLLFSKRLQDAKKQFYSDIQSYLNIQEELPHQSLQHLKNQRVEMLPQALKNQAVRSKN